MSAAPRQLPAYTHMHKAAVRSVPCPASSTVQHRISTVFQTPFANCISAKSELQKHEIKLILCINQPLFINMMLTAFAALQSYRHIQCSLQASSLLKRLRFCTRICPKVWVSERKTINFFLHLTVLLMFTINVCSS